MTFTMPDIFFLGVRGKIIASIAYLSSFCQRIWHYIADFVVCTLSYINLLIVRVGLCEFIHNQPVYLD